ncbi:MAG: YaiI/YqxD family protein [Parvibaculaceae bacterium]|nr:YaiI/YqxD family protein [Parvibaculaceae bacterium]
MTILFIDADACPVKDEAIKVADRHKLKIYIVSNGGLRPNPHPLVETIVVPDGPDIADQWIADRAKKGDVVVTGDIPLAARCIENGARVVRHNGEIFTPDNIGNQLATRDLMTDLRAADPFRQGGGRPFSKADRSAFLNAMETEVRRGLQETDS